MYTCPNCSELIGDNVRVCPICQHPVTEEEYRKAESIKESLQEQSVLKAMEEYRRRTRYAWIATPIFVIVILAISISFAVLNIEPEIIILSLLIVLGIYLTIAWKLRIGLCPHCESMMGRGTLFRTHCPRCGGRLK